MGQAISYASSPINAHFNGKHRTAKDKEVPDNAKVHPVEKKAPGQGATCGGGARDTLSAIRHPTCSGKSRLAFGSHQKSRRVGGAPQEIPEEGTPLERAEKEDLAELAPEAPAEQDDSLLGIFKSEEAKNLELGSLTDGLEDIDVNELLQDCRHLATQLRRGPPP